MVPSCYLMNLPCHLHKSIKPTFNRWALLSFCFYLFISGTAISGTPIEQDPNGFFGIQWGNPLANRNDLKEIDVSNTLHVYTLKRGEPHVEGILMESVKLYGVKDQYARASSATKGQPRTNHCYSIWKAAMGKAAHPMGE